jgi:glycosyltransferase involved in cell wall biosynthesis
MLVGYASPHYQGEFTQLRSEFGLDNAVRFLGVVPDQEKWRLLTTSRVCMFLSRVEGWGFVPIEALSFGLPVVVYDLPCYRESLRGLEGVFKVAVGDMAGAAKHAVELLTMPDNAYAALTNRIHLSFRYPGWTEIASTELDLILGGSERTRQRGD